MVRRRRGRADVRPGCFASSDRRQHPHRDADQPPPAQPPRARSSAPTTGVRRLSDEAFTAGLCRAEAHLLRALFTADARDHRQHARARAIPISFLQDVQLLLWASACSPTIRIRRRSPRWRRSARSAVTPRQLASPTPARATQTPDATACVSTRAASALLLNTSPCCRAESSSSSPRRRRLRSSTPSHSSRGNCDRVAIAHAPRQAAGLRPHRAGDQLASSPTASPCTTARNTCSSTTRRATSHR